MGFFFSDIEGAIPKGRGKNCSPGSHRCPIIPTYTPLKNNIANLNILKAENLCVIIPNLTKMSFVQSDLQEEKQFYFLNFFIELMNWSELVLTILGRFCFNLWGLRWRHEPFLQFDIEVRKVCATITQRDDWMSSTNKSLLFSLEHWSIA